MVAVSTETTDPKLMPPRIYWVITMIAPPQPGNAPSAAAIGTCQTRFRASSAVASILNQASSE